MPVSRQDWWQLLWLAEEIFNVNRQAGDPGLSILRALPTQIVSTDPPDKEPLSKKSVDHYVTEYQLPPKA